MNPRILSYKKIIEKSYFFKYLLLGNTSGVYCLINEKKKRVLIQSSRHMLTHLLKTHTEGLNTNRLLKQDIKQINIKLLSQCSPSLLPIEKLKWLKHYTDLGYTLYNQEKLPSFKVRYQFLNNEYQVQLVTSGRRVYSVKTFNSHIEAEDFINSTDVLHMFELVKLGSY